MKVIYGGEGTTLHVSTFGNRDVHLWVGPIGLHLFLPDIWKSRLDWCWNWR